MDNPITQEELKKLLSYNQNTGDFTWKIKPSRGVSVGTVAGTIHKSGYRVIVIHRKQYPAHRLAFLYMTGKIPKFVDHKNNIRSDNSWNNLREATRSENARNRVIDRRNTSGEKGVFWHKRDQVWYVALRKDNTLHRFGCYKNYEVAVEVARKEKEILHGEFAK